MSDRSALGGGDLARPTCQLLPPGFAGFRPYCPFTASGTAYGRPDLATARRLVERSGTRGAHVVVQSFGFGYLNRSVPEVMVRTLRRLGYDASLRVLPVGRHFQTDYYEEMQRCGAQDLGLGGLLRPVDQRDHVYFDRTFAASGDPGHGRVGSRRTLAIKKARGHEHPFRPGRGLASVALIPSRGTAARDKTRTAATHERVHSLIPPPAYASGYLACAPGGYHRGTRPDARRLDIRPSLLHLTLPVAVCPTDPARLSRETRGATLRLPLPVRRRTMRRRRSST